MAAATASAAPGVSSRAESRNRVRVLGVGVGGVGGLLFLRLRRRRRALQEDRAERNTRGPSRCRRPARRRRRRGRRQAPPRPRRGRRQYSSPRARRRPTVGAKGRGERRGTTDVPTSAPASDASAPSRKAGSIRPALRYTFRRSALNSSSGVAKRTALIVLRTTPFRHRREHAAARGERETHRADWALSVRPTGTRAAGRSRPRRSKSRRWPSSSRRRRR